MDGTTDEDFLRVALVNRWPGAKLITDVGGLQALEIYRRFSGSIARTNENLRRAQSVRQQPQVLGCILVNAPLPRPTELQGSTGVGADIEGVVVSVIIGATAKSIERRTIVRVNDFMIRLGV